MKDQYDKSIEVAEQSWQHRFDQLELERDDEVKEIQKDHYEKVVLERKKSTALKQELDCEKDRRRDKEFELQKLTAEVKRMKAANAASLEDLTRSHGAKLMETNDKHERQRDRWLKDSEGRMEQLQAMIAHHTKDNEKLRKQVESKEEAQKTAEEMWKQVQKANEEALIKSDRQADDSRRAVEEKCN